jgi:hypothetical protein
VVGFSDAILPWDGLQVIDNDHDLQSGMFSVSILICCRGCNSGLWKGQSRKAVWKRVKPMGLAKIHEPPMF